MSYPINYPTPQGANVQIFQGGITNTNLTRDWVKPQGASFVFFTLIGAGGGGGGGDYLTGIGGGGGSGAVTNFMCPAFLIPDVLQVVIGRGGAGGIADGSSGSNGNATQIRYQQKDTTGYLLLEALGGSGGSGASSGAGGVGGVATTNNYFSAMGFLNRVAGQNGADGAAAIAASTTTFLGGGCGGAQTGTPLSATGNYGYVATTATGKKVNGFFQMQPIIVGVGGPANYSTGGSAQLTGGMGGAGCGGGGGSIYAAGTTQGAGGRGGDGLVVIVTW